MKTTTAMTLILVASVAAGAAAANAGNITVDQQGHRLGASADDGGVGDTIDITQRTHDASADVTTRGRDIDAHVTQTGPNSGLELNITGQRLDIDVITGICPSGSAPQRIDVRGQDARKVIVPRCVAQ